LVRLKEIYNRPKVITPAHHYSQQHLEKFSLAGELAKQRKHLELHMTQHTSLKNRVEDLHEKIKEMMPKYAEVEYKKGLAPVSYA
jgi:hypothetical protein